MTGVAAGTVSAKECAGGLLSGKIVLSVRSDPGSEECRGCGDDVSLLSDEERFEAGRFKVLADQVRFIRGRALVRRSLSKYADVVPSEWRIERDAAGKPFVAAPFVSPRIHFNVSHTRGLVLCVVSRLENIGADAEVHSFMPDLGQVAGLVLSPMEMGEWNWSPPSEKIPRFFDLWTLKEAYSKARGIGLGLPFDQVGFRRDSFGKITVEFGAEVEDVPALWRFWQPRISELHSVAVAVRVDAENCLDLQLEIAQTTP